MKNSIFYTENNNKLFIKAKGHITAQICFGLRQRVFRRLEEKPEIRDIYVDLSHCEYMDSTFMGLLIGFNKKFYNLYRRKLCVIHPSQESLSHFADLGLDKILSYSERDITFPESMETISQKEKISPEFILKAHENLIEISEDNRKKFKIVKELLSKQIKEKKGNETSGNPK
ncbi:MAG: STAS domain-containing protein [Spirochaetales bacterium]|nr:STAS domain-containing protein [Spirochaetales bacterium]